MALSNNCALALGSLEASKIPTYSEVSVFENSGVVSRSAIDHEAEAGTLSSGSDPQSVSEYPATMVTLSGCHFNNYNGRRCDRFPICFGTQPLENNNWNLLMLSLPP